MRNMIIYATVVIAAILSSNAYAGEWTTPAPVSGVNSSYSDWTPYLSYDGLSLYFSRYNTDTFHDSRIFEAKRSQPYGAFTSVSQVLSSGYNIASPWVSPDNLRLYYHEERNPWVVKVSQRASVNDSWTQGTTINLGSAANPAYISLSEDELTMTFDSHVSGSMNWDLYIATRPDRYSQFNNIRSLTEINTSIGESNPALSPDALTIYYHSDQGNILKSTRQSLNDPFGTSVIMSAFDIPGGYNIHPAISSDGTAFYFSSIVSGQPADIYVSYYVPEPATFALMTLGAFVLRKRKTAK